MNIMKIIEALVESRSPYETLEGKLPESPGLYAIFADTPGPLARTILRGHPLEEPLYIGKSQSSLYDRDFKQHFTECKTGRSTVRRSFGAILRLELALKPIKRGDSGKLIETQNYKFDKGSEGRLSDWMRRNLSLGWWPQQSIERIQELEKVVIQQLNPPLNIQHSGNPLREQLEDLRRKCRSLASRSRVSPDTCH